MGAWLATPHGGQHETFPGRRTGSEGRVRSERKGSLERDEPEASSRHQKASVDGIGARWCVRARLRSNASLRGKEERNEGVQEMHVDREGERVDAPHATSGFPNPGRGRKRGWKRRRRADEDGGAVSFVAAQSDAGTTHGARGEDR
eukprot:scaffold1141_cov333-Pavlova_lutheri.AAC.20